MKRLFWLSICLMMAIGASAQKQQGVVKTKGRMVNGKHVPGVGLPKATVKVQGGNAVTSQNNGAFSFTVPAKTFLIQSVQKNGYKLVDADATKKPNQYSANPLYLVMEKPDQQMEDQLEAEEKISNTLRQQLRKARQEIQKLKDEHRISEEEAERRIAKLMQDQQNNQKLIADMAKEYAQMDYDQMDDLNRRISDAILDGRLSEADSLLRSKGDINSRIARNKRKQETEAQREKELAQQQAELAESKAGTQKEKEDIAADCYKFFDRFKLANQHDSAAHYIQLRAELDTTNAEWQFDAAYYLDDQNQHNMAIRLYERALDIYRRLAKSNPQAYEPNVAVTLNNLAILYKNTQRFTEGEVMYKEALEIRRRLAKSNPQAYEPDVSATLNNLASLYYETQRLTEGETMYKEALVFYRRLAKSNPQTYEPKVAMTLNNLANLYSKTHRFTESEAMYKEALETYRQLAKTNPQTYEPDVAMTLNNLANLYYKTQRLNESEALFKEALVIYQRLAKSNPQAYEPGVAMTLNNLASLYREIQRLTESEAMYMEALEIRQRLSKVNPQPYEPDAAVTLTNIGILYYKQGNYTMGLEYFDKALAIFEKVYGSEHHYTKMVKEIIEEVKQEMAE